MPQQCVRLWRREDRESRGHEGAVIREVGKFSPEVEKRILDEHGPQLRVVGTEAEDGVVPFSIPLIKGVILPGFVKSHGHDHEAALIGLAKGVPLVDWLDQAVNPFTGFLNEQRAELKDRFGKSPNYIAYIKARLDDIYYGITSTLVHHCNHNKYHVEELVEANIEAGTKMIIAVGAQDRHYDERILDKPASVAVERMESYWERFSHAERTSIIPGPDQFFSNGPELLKELKIAADARGSLVHCHSSEEPRTTKWFTEQYGMTPVEYAHSVGFLGERTILAHQVNNTDHDLELLKETGTKIVHNPLANTILGSGMPPIVRMMEMGIPVSISTDGSGSADIQNMLLAARLAVAYQRANLQDPSVIPEIKALEMITAIPAEFMRLNCGQLAPGKDADFIVIDLRRPNLIPTHLANVVENLIWATDGSEVRYVMANGLLLKDDYKFTTLRSEQILREIEDLTTLFVDYMKTSKIRIHATGARSTE